MSIEIRQLSKQFGSFAALRSINLKIHSGELLALLGPSGSGKTTLLRVIAGLETADAGQVLFNDEDATDQPIRDRQVGFVFQHYALFRNMTIFENVAFGLRVRPKKNRLKDQEIRERVTKLLKLVQLDWLADRYPHQLSGGQRQRITVARTLLLRPRLVIADEPVSMVDASLRATILESMYKVHQDFGISFLYITHDLTTAYQVSDSIVILYRGIVAEAGDIEAVIKNPQHPYTQELVNSIPLPSLGQHWIASDDSMGAEAVDNVMHQVRKGCKYATRCPHVMERCRQNQPPLYQVGQGQVAACYLYDETPALAGDNLTDTLHKRPDFRQ